MIQWLKDVRVAMSERAAADARRWVRVCGACGVVETQTTTTCPECAGRLRTQWMARGD